MKRSFTQGSSANIFLCIVGTTSMLLANPFQPSHIGRQISDKEYQYPCCQEQDSMSFITTKRPLYSLKNERMQNTLSDTKMEHLIDMPVVKRIKAKFKKPVPLEFVCVDDDQGF